MSCSTEIFEKFGYQAFTFDPAKGQVQLLSTDSSNPPLRLVRALAPYCRQSRRNVLNSLRVRNERDSLLLHPKHSDGEQLPTELSWQFESENGMVIGMLRTVESDFALEQVPPSLQTEPHSALPLGRAVMVDQSRRLASNGAPLPAVALSSPRERLVQLHIALEGANLGFWDWNRSSNSFSVNGQWAKMVGVWIGEIKHSDDFFTRLHPEDKIEVDQALARYIRGRAPMYRARFRLRHAKGHYVHVEAVGAFQMRRTLQGFKEMHLVGIHRDRSEDVASEAHLKNLLEQANLLTEAKSRFLANVSHEIRTPVHGLLNLVELAKGFPTTPPQRGYLDTAIETAHALGFKLDGLVDFATLGITPLVPKQVKGSLLPLTCLGTSGVMPKQVKGSLLPLFDMAKRHCAKGLREKNLRFNVTIDPQLSPVYDLDEKLIAQILVNLLDNAVKFTHEGQVDFSARLLKRSERPDEEDRFVDEVELVVADTGVGMSQEQMGCMFLPYQQRSIERNRLEDGIGVGLSLVHTCIEALGGSVNVRSEPGFGTEVTVRLNVRGYTGLNQTNRGLHSLWRASIRRVLVVDDVGLNRMILSSALTAQGLEVQEAENGEAVLNLFKSEGFETDLVLMDVQMPIMDGITATERLRRDLGVTIPIVGVTADATRQTEHDGLAAGMNQMLFKPLDVQRLIESIRTQTLV